jgi:hypothetical protein
MTNFDMECRDRALLPGGRHHLNYPVTVRADLLPREIADGA